MLNCIVCILIILNCYCMYIDHVGLAGCCFFEPVYMHELSFAQYSQYSGYTYIYLGSKLKMGLMGGGGCVERDLNYLKCFSTNLKFLHYV